MRIVIPMKKSSGLNYFFKKFLAEVCPLVENNFNTFE